MKAVGQTAWADIINGDASMPVTFTAQADAGCADKFDITEEAWEAASPLNDMIKSTDTAPHAPIAGGKYWYSIVLTAKDGYVFSRDFSDNLHIKEGSGVTFTVDGVSYTGALYLSGDGKTLTAWEFMAPVTVAEGTVTITAAAVENVKLDYKHGDAPPVRTNMRLPTSAGRRWRTATRLRSGIRMRANISRL